MKRPVCLLRAGFLVLLRFLVAMLYPSVLCCLVKNWYSAAISTSIFASRVSA